MPDKNPLYNTSGPRAVTEEDKDAMNAMMKAKLAYAEMHGNSAAKRMVAPTDNPYIFDDGNTGTHHMASYGKYAIPNIQDVPPLEYTGPRIDEAIKFDREEDAKYFAENYKNISPALRNGGAMAPNIPTWDYPSKGAFVRDTTDAPPKKYDKGGLIRKLERITNSTKKFNNGGGTDDPPYSTYNFWKNRTQPYDKFGNVNPDYKGTSRIDQLKQLFNQPITSKPTDYNIGNTNLDLKIEIPQNPPTDYIFDSYGWDFKKEYGEDGTPHYYRSKAGTDKWEDLHTVKGNALAAVKALEFGDDMSYIGTDAHKKQRQYYYEEGLKNKGMWLGPMEVEEREKLYNWDKSKEPPNMILTYAQDANFINSIANWGMASNTNIDGNWNNQIKRGLLRGTHGYNPATGQLIKLSGLGEAGQSRIVDTKSLNDPYLNYTLEGVEGEMKDPNFHEKRYKKEQKAAHKELTDYINQRHLVHINDEKAWRGHMGAYPIFAEDVYTDDEGNVIFRDQGGMQKRLTGDPVDLYNYGGRDVYMTDAEEEAYRKAMLLENNRVMWDSPIMDLPGLAFGFSGLARTGAKQALKHYLKKQTKTWSKALSEPFIQNISPTFARSFPAVNQSLTANNLMTVGFGVPAVTQYLDPNSKSRQIISQYQNKGDNLGELIYDSSMNLMMASPLIAQGMGELYKGAAGGINIVRSSPYFRDFRGGWNAYRSGEAKLGDLLKKEKIIRFNYSPTKYKFDPTDPTKGLFFQSSKNPDLASYLKGATNQQEFYTTLANAKNYNLASQQNRLRKGLDVGGGSQMGGYGSFKDWQNWVNLSTERSIAGSKSAEMQNALSNLSKTESPKTMAEIKAMINNPENYWKMKEATPYNLNLIKNLPANKYEYLLSPNMASNLSPTKVGNYQSSLFDLWGKTYLQGQGYRTQLANKFNKAFTRYKPTLTRAKFTGEGGSAVESNVFEQDE